MKRAIAIAWDVIVVLTFVGVLVMTCAGCGKATDNARVLLGEGVRCVQRNEHLAYCVDKHGRGFVCDDDTCLPAMCGSVAVPLEAGTGSKQDP